MAESKHGDGRQIEYRLPPPLFHTEPARGKRKEVERCPSLDYTVLAKPIPSFIPPLSTRHVFPCLPAIPRQRTSAASWQRRVLPTGGQDVRGAPGVAKDVQLGGPAGACVALLRG